MFAGKIQRYYIRNWANLSCIAAGKLLMNQVWGSRLNIWYSWEGESQFFMNSCEIWSTIVGTSDVVDYHFSLDNAASSFKHLADVYSEQLTISLKSQITHILHGKWYEYKG